MQSLPDKNSYGAIYCTTNLVNGKKYIGQTRVGVVRESGYVGSGNLIKEALKKYGRENFEKEVLQYCIDEDDLNESEKYWIDYFGAVKSDIFYNLSSGGQRDTSRLPENRLNRSEIAKKNFVFHENSKKALEKLSQGRVGTKSSEKTRLKISLAHKGLPIHENTKQALLRSTRKPVVQLNRDGSFVAQFEFIRIAAESFGLNEKQTHTLRTGISDVAKGKRKISFGFKWMYLKDYQKLHGK